MKCNPTVQNVREVRAITLSAGRVAIWKRTETTLTCPCGWKDRTFDSPAAIKSLVEQHLRKPAVFRLEVLQVTSTTREKQP